MSITQPQPNNKQNAPSHSKLHRVIASDSAAPDLSLVVNADGSVSIANLVAGMVYVAGGKLVGGGTSDNVTEGSSNLYFTAARARSVLSGTAPISYDSSTGTFSLAASGVTPGSYTSANVTVDAYGRVTSASNGSGGGGAVSSVFGRTGAVTAQSGDYTTTQVTEGTNLYYTAARFNTAFAAKSTSDLTEGSNLYFTEARVRATVLTGLSVSGSTITSSDSVLTAFGKVQSQINALVGGVNYQGTWNASTNSPTLASSTGTKGYYYVVTVAGSTNLDGITDWKIGDWAIFNGSVWQKVDNTDAVVSVNGQVGVVVLTTANIAESGNLYYTDARARAALSGSNPISYNSSTGAIGFNYAFAGTFTGKQIFTGQASGSVAAFQANDSSGNYIAIAQQSSRIFDVYNLRVGNSILLTGATVNRFLYNNSGGTVVTFDLFGTRNTWTEGQDYFLGATANAPAIDINAATGVAAPVINFRSNGTQVAYISDLGNTFFQQVAVNTGINAINGTETITNFESIAVNQLQDKNGSGMMYFDAGATQTYMQSNLNMSGYDIYSANSVYVSDHIEMSSASTYLRWGNSSHIVRWRITNIGTGGDQDWYWSENAPGGSGGVFIMDGSNVQYFASLSGSSSDYLGGDGAFHSGGGSTPGLGAVLDVSNDAGGRNIINMGNMYPVSDVSYDLGQTGYRWNIGYFNQLNDSSGIGSYNIAARLIYGAEGNYSVYGANRQLYDETNTMAMQWTSGTRGLFNASGQMSVDYTYSYLYDTNNNIVSLQWRDYLLNSNNSGSAATAMDWSNPAYLTVYSGANSSAPSNQVTPVGWRDENWPGVGVVKIPGYQ